MKLKYISWLPAVIIMAVIFTFSSKPVNASNKSSMTLANHFLNIYENITQTKHQGEARTELMESINHIVRKTAHFCEYAILAAAFALHFYVRRRKGRWLYGKAIIFASLYAATDEFHQTLVPGRGGMVKDVLLDSAGAVTGTFCFFLIILYIIRKRNKRIATLPE